MKTINVYYSSGGGLRSDFNWYGKTNSVRSIKDADIVVFTGGGDVSPEYYKEKCGKHTYPSPQRDMVEFQEFEYALQNKIPMFGICRGHQLICVGLGGSLIQHVSHGHSHSIHTYDEKMFNSNSVHHQMINPYAIKDSFDILAWTNDISHCHLNGDNKEIEFEENQYKEIEVIAYPELNIVSCQFHPEWQVGSACNNWLKEQVDKFIPILKNEKVTNNQK